MSELPDKAASVLALAKRGHDPPDDVPLRVRTRVDSVVANDPSPAPDSPRSVIRRSGFHPATAKMMAMGATAALLATLIWAWQYRNQRADHATAPEKVPPDGTTSSTPPAVGPTPAESSYAQPQPPADLAPAEQADRGTGEHPISGTLEPYERKLPDRSKPPGRAARSQDSLAGEIGLLAASSQALDAQDPMRALRLLDQYRTTYEKPLMQQEHDGLRILARCTLDQPGARSDARDMLASHPASVLRVKLIRACGLNQEEL